MPVYSLVYPNGYVTKQKNIGRDPPRHRNRVFRVVPTDSKLVVASTTRWRQSPRRHSICRVSHHWRFPTLHWRRQRSTLNLFCPTQPRQPTCHHVTHRGWWWWDACISNGADDGTSGDEGNSSGTKPEARYLKAHWQVMVVGQIPYAKQAATDCGIASKSPAIFGQRITYR